VTHEQIHAYETLLRISQQLWDSEQYRTRMYEQWTQNIMYSAGAQWVPWDRVEPEVPDYLKCPEGF